MTSDELRKIMKKYNMSNLDLAYELGVTIPTVYSLLKKDELNTLYTLAIKQIVREKEGE